MLAVQFQASFQNAVAQDSSRHILARYSLESKVLADRLKGVTFSQENLAKYADQLCSYTADERMRVTDADGQVVFSNLKDSPPLAEDSYQVCRTGEQLSLIHILGLQQVILPIISFNYGAKNTARVRETRNASPAVKQL